MLDQLFGRRFFIVVNHKVVQKDLGKNYKYYLNIYRLHAKWKEYRLITNKDTKVEELILCAGKHHKDLQEVLKNNDIVLYNEIYKKIKSNKVKGDEYE
jgi:hypothetical protein